MRWDAAILGAALLFSPVLAARKAPPAEPPKNDDGLYEYQAVADAPGPQTELHRRAQAWVATAYRSAQPVVQLDDVAAGRIVLKGALPAVGYLMGTTLPVRYTLTIETQDGRYRYVFGSFLADRTDSQEPLETMKSPSAEFRSGIDSRVRELIASLEAAMKRPAEDW